MTRAFGRPQLAQRLRFDLADALARDVEFLADFFERVLALAADPETQPDHLLLFGRKRLQDVGGLVANVGVDHRIHRRAYPAVFNQIAQRRFAIAADRRFERHRIARNGLQLLDLFDRNVHAARDFVVGRSAAQLFFKLTSRPQELVHRLVHVNGNADGARLIGNGARDRLADPPGRVGRKFVAAPVFEFVGGAHQADVAFLNQVQQVQAAVDVFLGHRNHQPQVGFHQIFLGALGFDFAVTDHRKRVAQLRQGRAGGAVRVCGFRASARATLACAVWLVRPSSLRRSCSRCEISSTTRSISLLNCFHCER